jgi:hypothetical protein
LIRGEGATIADAEKAVFDRWQKEGSCNHRWGRQGYTNGGALCHHCKEFKSLFEPIRELGRWKKPITSDELQSIAFGMIRVARWDAESMKPESLRRRRCLYLRTKQAGITLPPTPPPESKPNFFEEDPYREACNTAVLEFYITQRTRYLSEASKLEISERSRQAGDEPAEVLHVLRARQLRIGSQAPQSAAHLDPRPQAKRSD